MAGQKSRRSLTPNRTAHGKAAKQRQLLIRALRKSNRHRDPERLALKYEAMRSSLFAFARGEPQLFYAQVDMPRALGIAPKVWLCGDLHVENFGVFHGADGRAYFDLNDFDFAALAPCAVDLVRLFGTLELAFDELDVPERARRRHLEACLAAYRSELARGKPSWFEKKAARGIIRKLVTRLSAQAPSNLLAKRTLLRAGVRRLKLGEGHALAMTSRERRRAEKIFKRASRQTPALRELVLRDAARRVSGLASLGLERYVLLASTPKAAGRYETLIDIKEARPAAVPGASSTTRWRSDAERVVSVQQIVDAAAPAGLSAVMLGRKSFVVRELQPREARVKLKALRPDDLGALIADVGTLTAWAHLRGTSHWHATSVRSLTAFARRKGWAKALRTAALAAASRMRELHRLFRSIDPAALLDAPQH